MKLLFDEGLSPKLVELLRDLFPEAESALQNGLARRGDCKILEQAIRRNPSRMQLPDYSCRRRLEA